MKKRIAVSIWKTGGCQTEDYAMSVGNFSGKSTDTTKQLTLASTEEEEREAVYTEMQKYRSCMNMELKSVEGADYGCVKSKNTMRPATKCLFSQLIIGFSARVPKSASDRSMTNKQPRFRRMIFFFASPEKSRTSSLMIETSLSSTSTGYHWDIWL
jgi:hypothetical protein